MVGDKPRNCLLITLSEPWEAVHETKEDISFWLSDDYHIFLKDYGIFGWTLRVYWERNGDQ